MEYIEYRRSGRKMVGVGANTVGEERKEGQEYNEI